MTNEIGQEQNISRFTVMHGGDGQASDLLRNLMQDTPAPTLIYLSEQYGLRRVPGLSHDNLIRRMLTNLTPSQLESLERQLIAARFGNMSVSQLLEVALRYDAERLGEKGKPRLDQVSADAAILVQGNPQRWVYTLRGHDVTIDLEHRYLSCDCHHFKFAARYQALCKHLVTAFELMPIVYARQALIDLLISREYGGDSPDWEFGNPRAA